MNELFLSWRSQKTYKWYPIGKLLFNGKYQFVYTKGALKANNECGFQPLENFPDFHRIFNSTELFPFFMNRILSKKRPEYKKFIDYLNIKSDDPIAILAQSGGRRETDYFELFPQPASDENGYYHIHVFAHGLSHLPTATLDRINRLQQNDPLRLFHDFQNPHDVNAYGIRTDDSLYEQNDRYIVGYLPRYLTQDISDFRKTNTLSIFVEKINPPAPTQFRLLCRLLAKGWEGFQPFSTPVLKTGCAVVR